MKRILFILLLTTLFISCNEKDFTNQKPLIEGYWEIKTVEMPDGATKEFTVNTSVDYIKIMGDSGVRKKLMPRLDGSFREFPSSEKFEFVTRNDSLLMFYTTPFANWMETVVQVNETEFVVKNKDGKRYVYHRFENIDFQTEE